MTLSRAPTDDVDLRCQQATTTRRDGEASRGAPARGPSSAARSRIRSSSVIVCQRVARRWPVRRIRPAVSNSRRRLSTWSRSPPVFSASAEVVSPPLSDSNDSRRSPETVANARRALCRGAFRDRRRDRDADSRETSADVSRLDCPELFLGELALEAESWEAAASVDGRRDDRLSFASSATRAAFNVWISSFSSRSRLSIDSTISWVVRMLLMLRTYAARPWPGPGRFTSRRCAAAGPRSTGTPGSAGRSRCASISTTRPRSRRCARLALPIGRGGDPWVRRASRGGRRRSPVYLTTEEEPRRVCGAAVYDELAAYCRARRRG